MFTILVAPSAEHLSKLPTMPSKVPYYQAYDYNSEYTAYIYVHDPAVWTFNTAKI